MKFEVILNGVPVRCFLLPQGVPFALILNLPVPFLLA